jgi:hypothetical protein
MVNLVHQNIFKVINAMGVCAQVLKQFGDWMDSEEEKQHQRHTY